jgi:twitching motility two-component system response regulator PilG
MGGSGSLGRFDTASDARPVFRIASFGMAYKFQRLLEIVLRHARHNPYRFELAGARTPESYDIAIVDMTVKGGPEVANTLRRTSNGRSVVKLGRRTNHQRGTDDLLQDQFTVQLLRSLNRAAEALRQLRINGFYNHPNAPRDSTAIVAPSNAVAQPVALRPTKIRALVIDDSPTVRRQMALALHQMGIQTEGVSGAQEALDVLSTRRYDLVFCDVMMPGGANGFELTKAIKRDRALRDVPLIILTSKTSPFDLLRGALAGCNSYLVKPVSLKALRETVVKNLRRSSRMDIPLEPIRGYA